MQRQTDIDHNFSDLPSFSLPPTLKQTNKSVQFIWDNLYNLGGRGCCESAGEEEDAGLDRGREDRTWGRPHLPDSTRNHLPHCKRQNTDISKQIFPEKEYRVSVPISTFMRLWVIHIFPRLVCLFCWRKYVDQSCLYKSLTDTWMWKLGLRPRYS